MKIRELKKRLIQRVIMGSVLLIFSLGGYFIIEDYSSTLFASQKKVQREIVALNAKIKRFEAKQMEYKESKKLWDRLADSEKLRNGLDIGATQRLFDEFKAQYLLRQLDVDLSKPEELNDMKTQTTVVESSKVDITFEALSDEYVYALLAAINEYMPGYITIKSFRISREVGVTAAVLEKIYDGIAVPMVKGNITLYWRDLKDVSE